jgi:hypothetical protein
MVSRLHAALLSSFVLLAAVGRVDAQSVQVEAFSGEPFGVGRVSVELSTRQREALSGMWPTISDDADRVFYPAYDQSRPVRRLLREFLDAPNRIGIYFLFQGEDPLRLSLHSTRSVDVSVNPIADERSRQRLLLAWWREYSVGRLAGPSSDYPPLVENYLAGALARRLDLPTPQRLQPAAQNDRLRSTFDLLIGTETLRAELQKDLLVTGSRFEEATIPLPEELPSPEPDVSRVAKDDQVAGVEIEPIALRVPEECFYLRTGSFANFQWLRHRLADWGGDVRNLVVERGVDYGLNGKMERQLALRETALADLLGPSVIADVAIIGMDTFQREGAALGILFQAKNNLALTADITQQRRTALVAEKGSKEEKLEIAGRQVSFISTPDNKLRSFYAVDGDFHLVTTSRKLVSRFLDEGPNRRALGWLPEFRLARQLYSADRGDTAFIFLSTAMFENLAGPHYRIETNRRLKSAVELEMLQLARLASRAEGKPSNDIEELITDEFLPKGFGKRPDGSRIEVTESGVVDSLRGARGTFIPVPDVPVDQVTRGEAADYSGFASQFESQWQQMDPVLFAIRREATDVEGLERVVLDIEATPLAPKHFSVLSQWLGPARSERLAAAPGDLVAVSASVSGNNPLTGSDHVLFGALREPDPRIRPALPISMLLGLPSLQGYIGASPNPGILRLIGAGSNVPVDAAGFSRLRTGIWRRQFDGFTVLSLHPEILDLVTPSLGFEPIDQPAQIWLTAGDLAQSSLAVQINSLGYRHAERISLGNTALLSVLHQQLRVPPERCAVIAEDLLQAKLDCPLGGTYEPKPDDERPTGFLSTALRRGSARADYQFPALNWLRGVQLNVSMQDARLMAHADLVMPVSLRDRAVIGKPWSLPAQAKKPPAAVTSPDAEPTPSTSPKGAEPNVPETEELPPPPRRTPPPPPTPSVRSGSAK